MSALLPIIHIMFMALLPHVNGLKARRPSALLLAASVAFTQVWVNAEEAKTVRDGTVCDPAQLDTCSTCAALELAEKRAPLGMTGGVLGAETATHAVPKTRTSDAKNETQAASWCQPLAIRNCYRGKVWQLVATDLLHGIKVEGASPTFVDLDGDGDQDLVVGGRWGELKYFEHVSSSTFVERTGADANPFHAIRARSPEGKLAWGASPAFVDLDGDGDQDLVIGDYSGRLTYFERMHNATFLERKGSEANPFHSIMVYRYATPTFVDLDGDGDQDLVVGDNGAELRYFEHMPDATFLERHGSPANPLHSVRVERRCSPIFVDFDGDGDQDLVVGEYSGAIHYFERMPDATFLQHTTADTNPFHSISMSSVAVPTFADLDGDGDKDLVVGGFTGELHHFEPRQDTAFAELQDKVNVLHSVLVRRNAIPTFVDLDGDGDQDLVVGDAHGKVHYFEHMPDATFLQRIGPDVNPLHSVRADFAAAPAFVDLDGDGGYQDLVVGDESFDGHGILKYFERLPNATFLERTGADANPFHSVHLYPQSVPTFVDLDNDGDEDLVAGGEVGRLQYFERMPDGIFLERTGADANPFHAVQVQGHSAPAFVDLDGDGDLDLVVGDYLMQLHYFEHMPDATFRERTGADTNPLHGIHIGYNSLVPTFVDLDGDGDQHLVVGVDSGSLKHYQKGFCVPPRPCSGNGICQRFSCTCLEGYARETKGQINGAECFFCAAGYEPAPKQSVGQQMICQPCAAGKSSAGRMEGCTACGEGTVAESDGSKCSVCMPGRVPNETNTFCKDCPPGQVATANFNCRECPAGRAATEDGTLCEDCPAGKRSLAINNTCEVCPAGTRSSLGSSSCIKCPEGWYSFGGTEDCATCLKGEVPARSQTKCEACLLGWTASPGDKNCELNLFLGVALVVAATLLLALLVFMWRRQQAVRQLNEAMRTRDKEKEKKQSNAYKKKSEKEEHATQADMLKQAIENGYRWRIWKSKIRKAEAELLKQERKYATFEAFLDIVQDGDIKLLRGSWLAEKGNIDRFRRRQDLRKEAFWEVNELRSQIQLVHFVIISYCWLHPVNPDPESKHLELIQHALKKRLEVSGEGQVQDIAIIIDYMSLMQHGEYTGENGEFRHDPQYDPKKERTDEEQRQFGRGLGLLNIPYAHKQVQVWLMKWTPEDHPKYMDRGWPYFEQAVAGLIKDTTKLVLLQREALDCESWDDIYSTFKKSGDGSLRRIPPLLPAAFEEEIKARKFTNGKNPQAFVAGLYKRTFTEVIGNAEVLWFVDLAWGNKHATNLADILCACNRLKQLLVCNNPIGKPGALALVTAASKCETLELLDMTGNAMSEGEREEVKRHPRSAKLELRVDGKRLEAVDESDVVVVEERRKTRVQEIEMSVIPGAGARTRVSSSSRATLTRDDTSVLLEDV